MNSPKSEAAKPRFTVGQTVYRQKISKHSNFEGDVEIVAVGRKWITVKAPGSYFEARFDAETMWEDNKGFGTAGARYWLSKADCDHEMAIRAAWENLRARFDDSIRIRARRPEHVGLAEMALITAILDGKAAMDEIGKALLDAEDSLQYVQDKHPEASGWGVRAERIEKIDAVLKKYWPPAG